MERTSKRVLLSCSLSGLFAAGAEVAWALAAAAQVVASPTSPQRRQPVRMPGGNTCVQPAQAGMPFSTLDGDWPRDPKASGGVGEQGCTFANAGSELDRWKGFPETREAGVERGWMPKQRALVQSRRCVTRQHPCSKQRHATQPSCVDG